MSWIYSNNDLSREQLPVNESLFSLANGYLGVRGNFEEACPDEIRSIRGTYINAFYDIVPIHYGERAYGYPQTKQKMMNVIDSQSMQLYLGEDSEPFSLFTGKIIRFERTLHMDAGYSERLIHWRSPHGRELILTFRRLVSFSHRELFAVELQIEPVNFHGKVTLMSSVNGKVANFSDHHDARVSSADEAKLSVMDCRTLDDLSIVSDRTSMSHLDVSCVSSIRLSVPCTRNIWIRKSSVETSITFLLNKPVTAVKKNIYTDSLRHGSQPERTGVNLHQKIDVLSFSELLKEQKRFLDAFWSISDVMIDGDSAIQEGIRFNLFHLLQSAGRDPFSSIAAKGLSGEGYEGHYFWDTEIFTVPFFTLTRPDIARHLLQYRYTILDQARKHAREMGHHQGTLFPWRTISGTECSAFFPAGTAQYHINADIAYSYAQYMRATGDLDFLEKYGFELIVETARIWIDIGHFQNGHFCIDDVTGPDEYTAIVNNNYYTNAMAQFNLNVAVKYYHILQKKAPETLNTLSEQLHLSPEEIRSWDRAAQAMYLPYDEDLKINPQDDTFLNKAVWDFAGTPDDHYPLLLHYHPLTLYRHQVCKQADTLLAHFLLEGAADIETIRNSFHYYEKITTHDSSLSTCIFSIMAARIGEYRKAYDYFLKSARIDLDNIQGNTRDGLHLANLGGSWMAILFGFAGIRITEKGLSLRPSIPLKWNNYSFHVVFQGKTLRFKIAQGLGQCQLERSGSLELTINNQKRTISSGETVTFQVNM
ncbi:glycosyl hydrolase family 65 protein [Sporolactobacillus sp. Y61]|uniref:Glycosyl hydrolase family 65 protein n=1 Tax=Sporolactobacillus sp. Y61 TaxID=3160863 RepID=A0AAU8IE22_9BACL